MNQLGFVLKELKDSRKHRRKAIDHDGIILRKKMLCNVQRMREARGKDLPAAQGEEKRQGGNVGLTKAEEEQIPRRPRRRKRLQDGFDQEGAPG